MIEEKKMFIQNDMLFTVDKIIVRSKNEKYHNISFMYYDIRNGAYKNKVTCEL